MWRRGLVRHRRSTTLARCRHRRGARVGVRRRGTGGSGLRVGLRRLVRRLDAARWRCRTRHALCGRATCRASDRRRPLSYRRRICRRPWLRRHPWLGHRCRWRLRRRWRSLERRRRKRVGRRRGCRRRRDARRRRARPTARCGPIRHARSEQQPRGHPDDSERDADHSATPAPAMASGVVCAVRARTPFEITLHAFVIVGRLAGRLVGRLVMGVWHSSPPRVRRTDGTGSSRVTRLSKSHFSRARAEALSSARA